MKGGGAGNDDQDALVQGYCNSLEDAYSEYAKATKNIYAKNSRLLTLFVRRQTEEGVTDELVPGAYEPFGSKAESGWLGSLQYIQENPYQATLDALPNCNRVAAADFDEVYEAYYEGYLEDALSIDAGTLTLEERAGGDALRVELVDGALGEAEGLEITGTFGRCDIQRSDTIGFF